MEIRSPSPRKKPAFLRKSSIYDDTPLAGMEYYWNCPWSLLFIDDFKPREDYYMMTFFADKGSSRPSSLVGDLKKEDDQLSEMLNTLMGEAKQIRGENSYTTTV